MTDHSGTPVYLGALYAEIERLSTTLATVRFEHANLLAAARATINADRDGEHDPLWYLTDELTALGHMPPTVLPSRGRDAFRIAIGLTLTDHPDASEDQDSTADTRDHL